MSALDVAHVLRAAEHRDVERRVNVLIANPRQYFKTGEGWNLQIEEDEIRAPATISVEAGFQVLDGGGAVSRIDEIAIEAAFIERPTKEKRVVLGILYEEHKWAWRIAGHG